MRSAEDLEGGALTYAEIKAIASGNPAVMEKVKVDTEIRKLDQLRSVHLNQQRRITWEIRDLPRQIREARDYAETIAVDLATRNANDSDQFTMQVGNRLFAGKGAREEAANALVGAVLSWRDDPTMQPRASFRGFEILSRGRDSALGLITEDERLPEIFVRGKGLYSANLSASSPVGTVQSIEHTLRSLDKILAEQWERVARLEKELGDYEVQNGRPFEHEKRLQELLQDRLSWCNCWTSTRAISRRCNWRPSPRASGKPKALLLRLPRSCVIQEPRFATSPSCRERLRQTDLSLVERWRRKAVSSRSPRPRTASS